MSNPDTTVTQALIDSVIGKLKEAYSQELSIDYYPEDPITYRLNHPRGALLLGYSRSQFGLDKSSDMVWVERELVLPLTLVFRKLNGPDGVISYLDLVRNTLTGFTPAHCDRPLRPSAEQFVSQQPGLWQYAQDWSVRTTQVQSVETESLPLFNPTFEEVEV